MSSNSVMVDRADVEDALLLIEDMARFVGGMSLKDGGYRRLNEVPIALRRALRTSNVPKSGGGDAVVNLDDAHTSGGDAVVNLDDVPKPGGDAVVNLDDIPKPVWDPYLFRYPPQVPIEVVTDELREKVLSGQKWGELNPGKKRDPK